MRTVVVLPFVPVTASHGAPPGRAAARRARPRPRPECPWLRRRVAADGPDASPGDVTTRSTPGGTLSGSPTKEAPAARSGSTAVVRCRSVSSTRAPRASRARAADSPANRTPQTSTVRPVGSSGKSAIADEVGVEQSDAERDRESGDDPEAHDDRDLLPPRSSKWWCSGAIRNTRRPVPVRRRVNLNQPVWMMPDSVTTANRPPRTTSSNSVRDRMARPAIRPPSAIEPVSPMKICAGEAFHHRKPKQALIAAAATSARSSGSRTR